MTTWTYGSVDAGLEFTITSVVDPTTSTTTFTVQVLYGSMNFNALYWSNGNTTTNDGNATMDALYGMPSAPSVGMNGDSLSWSDPTDPALVKVIYDGGDIQSYPGLGSPVPATYLDASTAQTSYQFTVNALLDLSEWDVLGVRATSASSDDSGTPSTLTSIKWVNTPSDGPVHTGAIDGFKFQDLDGSLATTEYLSNGLQGWTIALEDANHNQIATATTDSNGFYHFDNLASGTYFVHEVQQSGWTELTDSDHLATYQINVIDGVTTESDFVNFKNFNISGTKTQDKNGDGIGDVGQSGVTIFVDMDNSGTLTTGDLTAVTATDGSWSISNLGPLAIGHNVLEDVPAGYVQEGTTSYLLDGTNQDTLDFVNFKLFNISGTKFLDANDDNSTTGDAGLGGITIFIDMDNSGTLTNGDLSVVTAGDGTWSFANLGPTAVNHKVLEVLPTGYVETVDPNYTTTGANAININFGNYKFVEGVHGLSQGFWSTHTAAWDGKGDVAWANLVDKVNGLWGDAYSSSSVNVTQGKGGVYTGNDDIMLALQNTQTAKGVLLGDANGDGNYAGENEVTQFMKLSDAVTALQTSSSTGSKTIMLNQLIAAQLNIYNGDNDPGSYKLSAHVDPSDSTSAFVYQAGHDLVGEAVQWLNGTLPGEPHNGTGGTVNFLTSDASWNSKFFDTGINNPNNSGHDIMASGQDLKNVLQAFNMNQIVTSADDKWIGWSNDGGVTVLGIHANTPDNFWLVALEHNVITG